MVAIDVEFGSLMRSGTEVGKELVVLFISFIKNATEFDGFLIIPLLHIYLSIYHRTGKTIVVVRAVA